MSRTNSSTTKTPDDYIKAIVSHTARDMRTSLHPGVNYRHLARFLRPARQPSPSAPLRPPSGPSGYPFVIIHNLSFGHGDSRRVTSFDAAAGLESFTRHPFADAGSGHLIFVHGFPSPAWVSAIGAKYGIDPEVYHRFLTLTSDADFYDTPALPSASTDIITLPLTSTGRHFNSLRGGPHTRTGVETHFKGLDQVGQSIVRQFTVHDVSHFSIEQDVLVCVTTRRSEGWNAIIHLDVGRSLDKGPHGPWLSIMDSMHSDVFLPVIRGRSKISLAEHHSWASVPADQHLQPRSRFMQSASLLSHESYGRFLSEDLMRADAFYALSEIFSFAAAAENQFLNLLSSKLVSGIQHSYDKDTMIPALSSLNDHKGIIDRHMEQIQELLLTIERRGSPNWPSMIGPGASQPADQQCPSHDHGDNTAHEKIQSASSSLIADYQYILRRCQSLSRRYQGAIEHLRNNVVLDESKKAIEQAQGVARLTLLAFFFVPLSFTTSFFSMSFKELESNMSIWVWFAVSIPVLSMAMLICFWSEIQTWLAPYIDSWSNHSS